MSQSELADRLGDGFHQQTILKIEKGQRSLKLHEAARMAEALGVSLDALVIADSGPVVEYRRIVMQLAELAGYTNEVLHGKNGLPYSIDELRGARERIEAQEFGHWTEAQQADLDKAYSQTEQGIRDGLCNLLEQLDAPYEDDDDA